MNESLILKKDIKEFVNLALELNSINPKLFESYKNRMLGAIEVQKLLQNKEVS